MSYKINSSADIKWIQYESLNDTMNTIRSNPNQTQAVCLVLYLLCYYLHVVPLDVDLPYVLCSRVSDYYNNMYNYYCVVIYVHVCMCIYILHTRVCSCLSLCVSMCACLWCIFMTTRSDHNSLTSDIFRSIWLPGRLLYLTKRVGFPTMIICLLSYLSYNLHWCALIHMYKCALLCCVCTCRCDCVRMWLHVCKIVHT